MRKRILPVLMAILVMVSFTLAGCGTSDSADPGIEDGTYVVKFTTDSPMFHVNDANNDKGILTVKDGEMTVHVSLTSQRIVNLYAGPKEDAEKDGAELLQPTIDHIVYGDGFEEDVYGFDIPVPAINEEFTVSLIGTKGKWYEHKVIVSDPVPGDDLHAAEKIDLEDGEYQVEITLEGGSGKATIDSPTKLIVKDGKATLTVIWSSSHYSYMLVNDKKYEPINDDGNSTFEIPVEVLDEPFKVIGNTTAMSEPHEIEYSITCKLIEE